MDAARWRAAPAGELPFDATGALLFAEDCDFYAWARREVLPALRYGAYELPGATEELSQRLRELQRALAEQRRDMDRALSKRGDRLQRALEALVARRTSLHASLEALAACKSAAEPTVLFSAEPYPETRWPPPERRATFAEARLCTPVSVFLKERLRPRMAAHCRYMFEAFLFAKACGDGRERGLKYMAHNYRVVPLYGEPLLEEAFAQCRAHFQDVERDGDNWRADAVVFIRARAWRHEAAARRYVATLTTAALVLAKNERRAPGLLLEEADLARADELFWPMLCAYERQLGLASYHDLDVRDGRRL